MVIGADHARGRPGPARSAPGPTAAARPGSSDLVDDVAPLARRRRGATRRDHRRVRLRARRSAASWRGSRSCWASPSIDRRRRAHRRTRSRAIIGAMIVAPLMGPIVGIAHRDRDRDRRRGPSRSLGRRVAGIATTVLIGVAMGAWLGRRRAWPRTARSSGGPSPTLIDLVVALAAGRGRRLRRLERQGRRLAARRRDRDLAGARRSATVGILLSARRLRGARPGAMLLFMTNFVSIVLAASVVFVLTGVAPLGRPRDERRADPGLVRRRSSRPR